MSQPSGCPECRHILPGGRKCRSIALKDQAFCYAHLRHSNLTEANRARSHSVALPPLEDWAAIQMSLDEIVAAFAAHKISRPEAGTYLYALQIASRNLVRIEQLPPPDPIQLSTDEHGEVLAAAPVPQSDTRPADASDPAPNVAKTAPDPETVLLAQDLNPKAEFPCRGWFPHAQARS